MSARPLKAKPRRWQVSNKTEKMGHRKEVEIDSAVEHKQKRSRRQAWRETRDLLRQLPIADLIENDLEP